MRSENVGSDTVSYINIYELNSNGYIGYPEPLYGMLCSLAGYCGLSFSLFQILLSYITISLASFTIVKYSPNILFSLFCMFGMYFICYSMNINRQAEACFVILYAYHFLYEKKKLKFVIWICVAAGLHAISLILLPLLFVYKLRITSKRMFWWLCFSFFIGLCLNENILGYILGPYAHYLSGEQGMREGGRIIQSIALAIYWMVGFVFVRLTMHKKLLDSLFFKFYLLSLIVNNLMLGLELGIRIVLLFSISQIIFYPIYAYNSTLPPKVAMLCVASYILIFFLTFIGSNSAGVVPYMITL